MSRDLARYALSAAEDAKRYRLRKERPEVLIERTAWALEYEALDTSFEVLSKVVALNPVSEHGMELVKDQEHGTETLIFDNGAHVERSRDCEAEEGFDRIYSLTHAGEVSEGVVLQPGHVTHAEMLLDELMGQVDDLLMIGDLDFGCVPEQRTVIARSDKPIRK